MRVIRRPVAAMTAVLLAVGAVAGCGGGSGQGGSSSTTVSPLGPDSSSRSSSAEPSSSTGSGSSSSSTSGGKDGEPELPAAAKEHNQAGAVAFAKFYWNETGRALHSGDTSGLEELSTDCVPCNKYREIVDKDAESGRHADINPTVLGAHKVTDRTDSKSDQAVTLAVEEKPYKLVDDAGAAYGEAEAVNYDVIVYLDQTRSGWTVVDLYMLS